MVATVVTVVAALAGGVIALLTAPGPVECRDTIVGVAAACAARGAPVARVAVGVLAGGGAGLLGARLLTGRRALR